MVLIGIIKVAIGIVALAISIAVYRHRKSVANANATALTNFFGKLGTAPAKGSTPKWIGFTSIGAMIVGSIFIIQGIFNLVS